MVYSSNPSLINHTLLVNDVSLEESLIRKSDKKLEGNENRELSDFDTENKHETIDGLVLKAKVYKNEARVLKDYLNHEIGAYMENRKCKLIAIRQISQTVYLEKIGVSLEVFCQNPTSKPTVLGIKDLQRLVSCISLDIIESDSSSEHFTGLYRSLSVCPVNLGLFKNSTSSGQKTKIYLKNYFSEK